MNEKGFYVLKNFIKEFGSDAVEYIVSTQDKNLKKDYYDEIKQIAKENNITFFNKSKINSKTEKEFIGFKFAIGWRWIIKNSENLIVFHDSLLPKYRGFAPLVNALIKGDNKIGVTALFADEEYDKGDIIIQKSLKVKYPIKIKKVINNIKPLYYELVKNIYQLILNNKNLPRMKQDEKKATYSPWFDKKDYFIDWNWNAEKIKRFVDAVGYPYDNAKTYLNGRVIKLLEVEVINDVKIENRMRHIGKVLFIKNGCPIVICKKGLLKLVDIRDEKNNKLIINFRSRLENKN